MINVIIINFDIQLAYCLSIIKKGVIDSSRIERQN